MDRNILWPADRTDREMELENLGWSFDYSEQDEEHPHLFFGWYMRSPDNLEFYTREQLIRMSDSEYKDVFVFWKNEMETIQYEECQENCD